MNLPVVFVFVPALLSVAALIFRDRYPRLFVLVSALVLASLSWLAVSIPLDEPVSLFGFSLPVSHSLPFLGRQLLFSVSLQPVLGFLYFSGSFFLLSSVTVSLSRIQYAVVFLFFSLICAAFLSQPFLYFPFFLIIIACLFSLLFFPFSTIAARGLSRFILFTSFSLLFLLLAGTELSIQEGFPPDAIHIRFLLLLLLVGFSFLLSLPPFHFWQLDISDDSPSFSVAFLLSLFPLSVVYFLSTFLVQFDWLRGSPLTFQYLRFGGLLLCVFGALLGLFQVHLRRLVIYSSMVNLGFILVSLSVFNSTGFLVVSYLFVARCFSLLGWFVSSEILRRSRHSDSLSALCGYLRSFPLNGFLILCACLSLSGFPLLFSFPAYWSSLRLISSSLPSVEAPVVLLVLTASLVLNILSVFRFVRVMFAPALTVEHSVLPDRVAILFSLLYMTIAIIVGIAPQVILPLVQAFRPFL